MRSVVNVIVTCTKSKRAAVAPECRLRSIRPGPLRQRAREWMERLRHQTNRICVADLYSGDHWSTVRSLRSSRFDVRVWVCSAGYGLVGVEDQLSAYSATFSKNHPDSVLRDVTDAARDKVAPLWWSALSRWRGPTKKNPRTITEIAERYPNSPLLIVASETYLYALAPDVRGAVWQFADPEYLAIISAGTKSLDGLTKHLVPCDARCVASFRCPPVRRAGMCDILFFIRWKPQYFEYSFHSRQSGLNNLPLVSDPDQRLEELVEEKDKRS